MKLYFFAGTIFSAFASANGDGSIHGKILVDGVKNDDISVRSCTADTVVVRGEGALKIRAGQVLAHIDGTSTGGSICTPCGPLFRKVVSISGDTLTTTFASFAEVFENDFYEGSDLSDALVEPQLQCPHSFHDDGIEESMSRRRMADTYQGLKFNTFCNTLWGITSYLMFIPVLFSGGLLFTPMNAVRAQLKKIITVWGKTMECKVEGNRRARNLWSEDDTMIDVIPSNSEEWKSKDDKGKCVYFNCDNPFSAFECFDSTNLSCSIGSHIPHHTLVDFARNKLDESVFQTASCNHEMCYSSNFDKNTCDLEFSRFIENTCASSEKSRSALTMVGEVTFPLSSKTISENCSLMSVAFYIGLHVFGHNARNELQSNQLNYQNVHCMD